MKEYIGMLKNTKLFSGVSEEDIEKVLGCLGAALRTYKKGEYVLRAGEHIHKIAILADGELLLQKDDYWGNRAIVDKITVGEIFGGAYVSPDSGALPNDVAAASDSAVIFVDIGRILTVCPSACEYHTLIIKNLFFALSDKNRKLIAKLGHISKRTTRDKLLSYLSDEAKRQNSSDFFIPFNRQQLADYLSVDRSAMSSELCKMRGEGIIRFDKNHFTLI